MGKRDRFIVGVLGALITVGAIGVAPAAAAAKAAHHPFVHARYVTAHRWRSRRFHYARAASGDLRGPIAPVADDKLQPEAPPQSDQSRIGFVGGTAHLDHGPTGLDDNVSTFGIAARF